EEYEGVLNMMLRWFNESTSDYIRNWAEQFMVLDVCPECEGTRLKKESLWFKVAGKNIAEYAQMPLSILYENFSGIAKKLSEKENFIAKDILKEISDRTGFLLEVGLHYLTLYRPTKS